MMSLRRAPIALRTPISRVRSVTETSMMFITPMPPTNNPIEEITTITSAYGTDDLAELPDQGFGTGDAEILRIGGYAPRRRRRSSVTSSFACSIFPGSTSTR